MFNGLRLGVPPADLARRTFREVIDDDCMGLAAQLVYYLTQTSGRRSFRAFSSTANRPQQQAWFFNWTSWARH